MNLTLYIWRQKNSADRGQMVRYEAGHLNPDMSMLEALDVLNEELIGRGDEPVAFEHDCREGICGSCGFMINGVAHGPLPATTVCQLTLRHFKDGQEVYLEPWRAKAFPIIKDLVVDRSAFDRIIASGGYISSPTGSAPDGNAILSAEGGGGPCHGCGGLHRLRSVRGGMSQCFGGAVHRRQDHASRGSAAGPAGARPACHPNGCATQCGGLWELQQHRRVRGGVSRKRSALKPSAA